MNKVMLQKCFACERDNPADQSFCGACGSPLSLADFISSRVSNQLSAALKDRDTVETESAIRVFERAWSWVRLVGGIAALLLAIVGAGVFWKVTDFWSGVNQAKKSVTDTADSTRAQIDRTAKQSLSMIESASSTAQTASASTANTARLEAGRIADLTSKTRRQIAAEATRVRTDVEKSRSELEAAKKIEPEISTLRAGLTRTASELEKQQKVLSSSEDFVKHVFSSHQVIPYDLSRGDSESAKVVPPPEGGNKTVVFLLLPSTPVRNTVQIQYHVFTQPSNSFFTIHNLLVFYWGDPPDNLKRYPLIISYFPDTDDKDLIHSLSTQEGRVFADDQPLPKLNQPDPDFKGNKWIAVQP